MHNESQLEELAQELATRGIEAAQRETALREGVRRFRRRLLREAKSCALDSLYHWNARGLEWYRAARGQIFLANDSKMLSSIPEAAAGGSLAYRLSQINGARPAESIIATVFESKDEYISNDVLRDKREGKPYLEFDSRTRSELAVPLFDPDEETVVGVLNLEANDCGVFLEVQAQELRRNAALLGVPLFILQQINVRRARWCWHPEAHGWSPGKILERFCHTVSTCLDSGEMSAPSCTVWCFDEADEKCWVLGTSGYDYDFRKVYSLGIDSAVARTARSSPPRVRRGTPDTLGFEALSKARYRGIHEAVLAPLRVEAGVGVPAFRGALALYNFHKDSVLPGNRAVRWLARQAEQLIEALYGQRVGLAKATIRHQQASKSEDIDTLAGTLRTIFPATRVKNRPTNCELDDVTRACLASPGEPQRHNNFGLDERVLEVAVPATPEAGRGEAWGFVRLTRAAHGRPFTAADAALLREIANSYHCCKSVFSNWKYTQNDRVRPFVAKPTPALLEQELRKAVEFFLGRQQSIRQGGVFVYSETAEPAYHWFAYYSPTHQLPPDERLAPLAGDLIGVGDGSHKGIISTDCGGPGESRWRRVCVPVQVWSGPYLVRAVCVLDFESPPTWDDKACERVHKVGLEVAAMLAWNRWEGPPSDAPAGQYVPAFKAYVEGLRSAGVARVTLQEDYTPDQRSPAWLPGPEPSLRADGIRLRFDGRKCAIPLRLGPFPVAVLTCELEGQLAKDLRCALERNDGSVATPADAKSCRRLRRLLGMISGAWCRVVAPNPELWSVKLTPQEVDGHVRIWKEEIVPQFWGEFFGS